MSLSRQGNKKEMRFLWDNDDDDDEMQKRTCVKKWKKKRISTPLDVVGQYEPIRIHIRCR
jgi:hypothetical protein